MSAGREDDLIARLARQIDAAHKTERLIQPSDVSELRRRGAAELHAICAEFVASLKSRLAQSELSFSPAEYAPAMFRDSGANLIQIGSEGRELQIAFQAPAELVSTEKFLIPYVLEGELRAYNQEMLEHLQMRTRLLFYCVEQGRALWRYFDWRTRHTGALGRDLLADLMASLF
jgi:hypothetical protein